MKRSQCLLGLLGKAAAALLCFSFSGLFLWFDLNSIMDLEGVAAWIAAG